MNYKRIIVFSSILLLTMSFSSCKKDKNKEDMEYTLQPKMYLQKHDTTEVMNLTTHFLDKLKNNKIDEAVSMLYYLDKKHRVIKLPDTLALRQKQVFKMFPVLSYKITGITFDKETDSQVKYTIEFFKKQHGDNRPNTISFFIKPMRVNNVWYLTMYDSNTNNGGESEIKN